MPSPVRWAAACFSLGRPVAGYCACWAAPLRAWAVRATACAWASLVPLGPLPLARWLGTGYTAGPPIALAAGPAGATAWAACLLGQAELGRFND